MSHCQLAGFASVTLARVEKQRGRHVSRCQVLSRAEPLYLELQRQSLLIGAALRDYRRLQEGLQTCP